MIVKQINFRITWNAQIKFSIDFWCLFKICYQTVNWVYLTFKLSLLSKIFYAQLDCTLIQKALHIAYLLGRRMLAYSGLFSQSLLGKPRLTKKEWAQHKAVGALCESLLFYFIATFCFVPFQRRLVKEITACIISRLLILCQIVLILKTDYQIDVWPQKY